jgi:ABC-2 type transport system ATP-binding protein
MSVFQKDSNLTRSIHSEKNESIHYDNCLEIVAINKSYHLDNFALKQVSLSMKNGMFGLLGPNGAGKSTLMRSIATLQPIDSGCIKFNGVDVCESPQAIRQVLGYLPQEFGVYPKCSADKLLHHLAVLKGVHNKKQRQIQIDYLLERTNLTQHRKIAVSDYSGGMRQRFGIAQALLGTPRILVVDEPTAGLDPHECRQFHHLLCELAESMIVLFSTHIVEDIQNLCSNLAIIDQGSIVFHGKPDALIQTLDKKLWSQWINQASLASVEQQLDVVSTRLHRGQHQLRVYADTCPAEGFEPTQPDLQDAYFYLLAQEHATRSFNAN